MLEMQDVGLSTVEVLKTATVNAAEILDLSTRSALLRLACRPISSRSTPILWPISGSWYRKIRDEGGQSREDR